MAGSHARAPFRLLTRLFLRQFLENDLISPDADRAQLLAVVGAMAVSLTLFLSMFLSSLYLGAGLTPGQAAVLSLNDKFFYLALSMVVAALVAAAQWDALAIDHRDAAILEPLPVPSGTIRRAKLAAIALLGAAVAVAINGVPSLVFPWLVAHNFRHLPGGSLLVMMAAHAWTTVAAAAFGYLAVIALRETMVAVVGRRGFAVTSPWVQGVLIVALGSTLLLLMPASNRIAQHGLDDWRAATPPMWFLGAYETLAGGAVADLPRGRMTARQEANDRVTTALYQQRRPQFPVLARQAGLAFLTMTALAVVASMWNARRLKALAPAPPPAGVPRWRLLERAANALLVRSAASRAGFYFTLAALWRSNTHRLTLACSAAAGFAMAVVALSNSGLRDGGGASARLLVMQPLLYGALLVGFRHLIRVPAELRANWGVQLAWRGQDRAFAAGAKRGAMIALVVPAVLLLLPFYVAVLGVEAALLHAGLGIAGGLVLLESLMLGYDKVPFTCTYVPAGNMKALAPFYLIAFLVGANVFSRLQLAALNGNLVTPVATLAAALAVVWILSATRRRLPQVEFDEAPAVGFQTLGLHT